MSRKSRAKPDSPFGYFRSSPEVIRLVGMMHVRFPLSLRNAEDLLFEHGIDLCHETVRLSASRFRCATLKTYCSSEASISATRRCGTGVGLDGSQRHRDVPG